MMKKITLLSAVPCLLLSQVFNIQIANADDKNYPINIVSDTTAVKFNRVKLANDNGKTVLSGKVKKRFRNMSLVPGHIDIAIKGSDDKVLFLKKINSKPARISKHSRFGSSFKVALPDDMPLNSSIAIQWHKDQYKPHPLSASFMNN